ncbi:hypothetical protein [uncultured Meiothermus sp.]|uniref:hypothetical protein n=1 Tax=uncultured Meiothermus sp. TaxID=157471 RepID=UPI00262C25C5|nr:hypothetical protein [uncultured Meiothermus sp.]
MPAKPPEKISAHTSRTMMYRELSMLLEAVPPGAPGAAYQAAVLQENVLLKKTLSSRKKTLGYLRALYVLRPEDPLFRALRALWAADPVGRPLLALLVALARDRVLRATIPAMVEAAPGAVVSPELLSAAIMARSPQMSPNTYRSAGQNAASTWTQSGHLLGRRHKVRTLVRPTPEAVALAMYLGHTEGRRGLRLFTSDEMKILDLSPHQLDALAFAASQRGWLDYKRLGEVAEFNFPYFERVLGASYAGD